MMLSLGMMFNTLRDQPALRRLARRCWPKEQHKTRGAAEAQMRSILRRDLAKDVRLLHPYLCPHCSTWHVGHNGLKENR